MIIKQDYSKHFGRNHYWNMYYCNLIMQAYLLDRQISILRMQFNAYSLFMNPLQCSLWKFNFHQQPYHHEAKYVEKWEKYSQSE